LLLLGCGFPFFQRWRPHVFYSNCIQVDPAKSKAAIMSVLEKLQKMAAARQREWDNDKIDQTVFKLYLSRILIQRSSM
jgi:hypothetical protein